MHPNDFWKTRWHVITPSQHKWEQDALNVLRATFAGRALQAWSNFEFITLDGNIYEVDLLLLTTAGLYLIEIKSWSGRLDGDAHTWVVQRDGRLPRYMDNPRLLARRKAQRLASLLGEQPALKRPGVRCPYVQEVVFLSHPDLQVNLPDLARAHVYDYADTQVRSAGAQPDMVRELHTPRSGPGSPAAGARVVPITTQVPAPVEAAVKQALGAVGVRTSNRQRRVGDYELVRLLGEGNRYRDILARHTGFGLERRIRVYHAANRSAEEKGLVFRAASREFKVADSLRHPHILRAVEFRELESGPALVYDYDPEAMRLDHFMQAAGARLDLTDRLQIVRQIGEALAYAHSRKILHCALAARSVLVTESATSRRSVLLMNWQTSIREDGSTTGTVHARELVEDDTTLYMAPEALMSAEHVGEYSDVFSLGALTYLIVTGQPPASDRFELEDLLREHKGLCPSAVSDGVLGDLDTLVQMSTSPNALERIQTVMEFLELLTHVEENAAQPGEEAIDPFTATPGQVLPGGFCMKERLGQGGVAMALLAERDGHEYVLKIARGPEQNSLLEQEAESLRALRDRHIVAIHDCIRMGERVVLLLDRAGDETLAQRLEKDGPLQYDLLSRFGSDLLDVVSYLELKGIPHRDIKPANLGVAKVGKNERLELMLFDFSLSRVPLDHIRAGTPDYLDPFLSLRRPPRWDLQAERYSVAVTLYEMATGILPRWGDGISAPATVECELYLEPERFEASLRDPLTRFFTQALHRDPRQRFDNAEDMKTAWKAVFDEAEEGATPVLDFDTLFEGCTADTLIVSLNLPPALLQSLDRLQVLTVGGLAGVPLRDIATMRGVGHVSRRRLGEVVRHLQDRLARAVTIVEVPVGDAYHGLDPIFEALFRTDATSTPGEVVQVRAALLEAAEASEAHARWPASSDLATSLGLSQEAVRAALEKVRRRWAADPSMAGLLATVADVVDVNGGMVTVEELAGMLLAARGSVSANAATRIIRARALARATLEVEAASSGARFALHRSRATPLVARSPELAAYAERLGGFADGLAVSDPLVMWQRAVQVLRDVPLPSGMVALPDARLLRLAAASSQAADLSSRQEFYPRGMEAVRALILAHGSLLGDSRLKVDQIRDRVASRYPEAQRLPDRPELDALLQRADWDFEWDPREGAYLRRTRFVSLTTGSTSLAQRTTPGDVPEQQEAAEVRVFEERLRDSERDGRFLVLAVSPRLLVEAEKEIVSRFDVAPISFEKAFIEAMRGCALELETDWDAVRATDAEPGSPDWTYLLELAEMAMSKVENQIAASSRTVLLSRIGLLARYRLMPRLERLRDRTGRRDGLFGLWVLLPMPATHDLPMVDGTAVPLLAAGQRARIPSAWLQRTPQLVTP